MDIDTIGTAVSAPVVAFIIEIIMRFTPKSFDRRRFALPMTAIVAIGLSVVEALSKSHISIWLAVVRGLTVGMASAGVYDVYNNYGKNGKVVTTGE